MPLRRSTICGYISAIQGGLHDVALTVGAVLSLDGEDSTRAAALRNVQFRMYRYLNAVHALECPSSCPSLHRYVAYTCKIISLPAAPQRGFHLTRIRVHFCKAIP